MPRTSQSKRYLLIRPVLTISAIALLFIVLATASSTRVSAQATKATADLTVSIADSPDPVATGSNITYTITVFNAGPDTANDVTLTDTMPASTSFVSLTSPPGWTCTTPGRGTGAGISCSTSPIPAGLGNIFTLVVAVDPGTAGGQISNTATVTSSTGDLNLANNTATTTTTVAPADLQVFIFDGPDPVAAGSTLRYTISAFNDGPSIATAVSLTDTLPSGTTFVSFSAPVGWSCTTPAVGSGGTISCTTASWAPSVGFIFSLDVATSSSLPGGTVLSNTVTVSSSTSDSNLANNSATATTTVSNTPSLSINDVKLAEGNNGTTTFNFTVSLSEPAPAGGVTFDVATADASAMVGSGDYIGKSLTGQVIPAGSTTYSFAVIVNGDTTVEPDETFTVNLSNVTGATVSKGQGIGTILNDDGAPSAGQIIISEFRLRGPGLGQPADSANDEFIELYNTTDTDFVVVDSAPVGGVSTDGWAIVSSDAPFTPKFVIPVGTRIPARGHYLITNGLGYSLSANTPADIKGDESQASYFVDIPDGAGLALFRTGNPLFFNETQRLDSVGFLGAPPLFFEGTPLQPAGGITDAVEHSFVRDLTTGWHKDTQNNQADFVLVAVDGAMHNGRAATLGAPGPENSESPVQRNGTMLLPGLIEPQVGPTMAPNRVRDKNPYTDTLSGTGEYPLGTMAIRRAYTNNTGEPITRLRFRIIDITAGTPTIAGTADVRAITAPASQSVTTSRGPLTIVGTTLELPPDQAQGGGINSTLSVETINLPAPLNSGETVYIEWLLGVKQIGNFRFYVNIEGLQGSSPGIQ